MLGYHPSEAWLVEQKTLPPKLVQSDRGERVYVLFVGQKTQCPQIDTKLTQFEDNGGIESFPGNITC